MQVRAVSAAAAIVVLALSTAACNPTTKSKATSTTPTQVPVATETQADAESPAATTAGATTASSAPISASATTSTPAASPSTPGPAAAGASLDACSLMTSAQASAINGVQYGAATAGHLVPGIDTCTYKNTGKHADELDIQDLDVQVISLPGCYTQLLAAQGPGVKIPGVGDDAFGHEIGIDVKIGDRCIDVSGLTHAEFGDNYAPDSAMAKIIISKLP
jgi:hypothetical protein